MIDTGEKNKKNHTEKIFVHINSDHAMAVPFS